MPYHVGSKGSNGCSGFPVVSDTGKVMGCHPSASKAKEQVQALYASGAADKVDILDLNVAKGLVNKTTIRLDKNA